MKVTTEPTEKEQRTDNIGLAKDGLNRFDDTFELKQAFVLRMNFSDKNPVLRQAEKH